MELGKLKTQFSNYFFLKYIDQTEVQRWLGSSHLFELLRPCTTNKLWNTCNIAYNLKLCIWKWMLVICWHYQWQQPAFLIPISFHFLFFLPLPLLLWSSCSFDIFCSDICCFLTSWLRSVYTESVHYHNNRAMYGKINANTLLQ